MLRKVKTKMSNHRKNLRLHEIFHFAENRVIFQNVPAERTDIPIPTSSELPAEGDYFKDIYHLREVLISDQMRDLFRSDVFSASEYVHGRIANVLKKNGIDLGEGDWREDQVAEVADTVSRLKSAILPMIDRLDKLNPADADFFADGIVRVANLIITGKTKQFLEAYIGGVDPLTGLNNRRDFNSRVTYRLSRGEGGTLLIMDLDHFKHVNDTFGHPAGDQVLRGFSRIIRESVKRTDMICRWGGEEFAVWLPDTYGPNALTVAKRIRAKVKQLRIQHEGRLVDNGRGSLSVSIGLTEVASLSNNFEMPEDTLTELTVANGHVREEVLKGAYVLERAAATADEALYNAKRGVGDPLEKDEGLPARPGERSVAGRNCVRVKTLNLAINGER